MNHTKINELKEVSDAAHRVLNAEQARLTEMGLKSKERYELLKPLKAIADEAHLVYSKYAKGQINRELCKIIAAQTPEQRAEGKRRARGW
jgi:hypothetical protein